MEKAAAGMEALIQELSELESKIERGEYITLRGQLRLTASGGVEINGVDFADLVAHLNLMGVEINIERVEDGEELFLG